MMLAGLFPALPSPIPVAPQSTPARLPRQRTPRFDQPKIDMTGQLVGRLRVLRRVGRTAEGISLWLCRCVCPDQKLCVVRVTHLRAAAVRSCGCLRRELMMERARP